MVLMREATKEECCGGGRLDTAWSNTSLPMNEVSLLGFLGIVSCKPCKGKQTEGRSANRSLPSPVVQHDCGSGRHPRVHLEDFFKQQMLKTLNSTENQLSVVFNSLTSRSIFEEDRRG